jgi:hypothetical protein
LRLTKPFALRERFSFKRLDRARHNSPRNLRLGASEAHAVLERLNLPLDLVVERINLVGNFFDPRLCVEHRNN